MALTSKLTAIADAIRAKTGKTAKLTLDQMPEEIAGLGGGGSEQTMTVDAGDLEPDYEDGAQPTFLALTLASDAAWVGAYAASAAETLALDMPDVAEVGDHGFEGMPLTSATLPSCAAVGDYAFYGCGRLEGIDMPELSSVGAYAFAMCPSLTGELFLPAATSVGDRAFYCAGRPNGITSVDLPAATSVGNYAFYDCTALSSVDLPEATSVGSDAFGYCTALSSVDLPAATSVGSYAFYNCTALSSVDLPAAASVGQMAFNNCTALSSVDLPEATSVGQMAFYNCASLTSADLPKATTLDYPFGNCTSLATLEAPSFAGSSIYTLGISDSPITYLDVRSCPSMPGNVPNPKKLEYLALGMGNPSSYTETNSTFNESSTWGNLKTLVLPNITSLSGYRCNYFLAGLTSLATLDIRNCTALGTGTALYRAFAGLQGMTLDVYLGSTVPTLDYALNVANGPFGDTTSYSKVTFHVPASALSSYKANSNWSMGTFATY